MRQQDIICQKCGKFILTEQEQPETGNIKCVKGSYKDGVYDKTSDTFFYKECGVELGV